MTAFQPAGDLRDWSELTVVSIASLQCLGVPAVAWVVDYLLSGHAKAQSTGPGLSLMLAQPNQNIGNA